MLNDIATGPPPWQMYVDKTQPSPVVGDGVPRRLVLAHGEGEQVEAGLDRVLPEDFDYWNVSEKDAAVYQMSLLGQILKENQP